MKIVIKKFSAEKLINKKSFTKFIHNLQILFSFKFILKKQNKKQLICKTVV